MARVSNRRFLLQSLAAWIVFMVVAVLDGLLRQSLLVPLLGDGPAHLVSGVIVTVAIYLGTLVLLERFGVPRSAALLWIAGIGWAALTVGFEALLIVWLQGGSPGDLAAFYHPRRILDGDIILIGLALMALAPALCIRWLAGRPGVNPS